MSWSLVRKPENDTQIRRLEVLIQDAARRNIIMYCAAADQGLYDSNDRDLFPKGADTQHIKAVGSANERGYSSTFVNENQVDYLFPGEQIETLCPGKGSSAATALAAGFAGLILSCFRDAASRKQLAMPKNMHKVFEALQSAKPNKWINITTLLGVKGQAKVDDVVKKCNAWTGSS